MLSSVGTDGSIHLIFCILGVGMFSSKSVELLSVSCSVPSSKTFLPMVCPKPGLTVDNNSKSEEFPKPNLSEISPLGFFKAKELLSVIALSVKISANSV